MTKRGKGDPYPPPLGVLAPVFGLGPCGPEPDQVGGSLDAIGKRKR